jgi:hypothetical protein
VAKYLRRSDFIKRHNKPVSSVLRMEMKIRDEELGRHGQANVTAIENILNYK